jgi:hypothetical protein
MELIIGLIVLVVVGYFVFFNKKESVASPAPYKVETPVEVTPVAAADVPVTLPVAEVVEAPAKAPRKPRAPKAEKPAAKKAPAKAKAPKAKATTTKATTKKPAVTKAKTKKA